MHALILAGGSGTRLWPRSRQRTPKQLLDLAASSTMLQDTYERLAPLVPPTNAYVITNSVCADEIRRQLPDVPGANVLVEPAGRNTAPAIGLGSLAIRRAEPQAIVAVLSADHLVQKRDEFAAVMTTAAGLAEQGYLVTIGIRPTRAETGYGYIELGDKLATPTGTSAYRVARFTEKPDADTAIGLVSGGKHLWNAGMFVWRVDSIMAAFERHLPALSDSLAKIDAVLGTDREAAELPALWRDVESISIDFGLMEKADNVAVVPADLGWSDIGTWASLAEVLPADEYGNVVIGGQHVGLGTRGSLVYGTTRLVATIGLEDMIVVDTEDAVLICPKDRAQDVKSLVDQLKQTQRGDYL
ncbi:MAG: mannose-1-phosphate guanylyltransferase [Anaerolineae bacterium]